MKKLFVFFVLFSLNLFPQHLPLKVGNQWHYDLGLGISPKNAAIAVDTVQLNNKIYYKIECREPVTYNLLWTTYDRMEGDSLYFRLRNGVDSLIFNFGWENGHIESIPVDTNCFSLLLIQRDTCTFWEIHTEYYYSTYGLYCIGFDTSWALSGYGYIKYFGALNANDGRLIGAVINGTTFGTLHILPVELISFTAEQEHSVIFLKWITATEVNNKGFEIERTTSPQPSPSEGEGEKWLVIGFVQGNGTATGQTSYSFKDDEVKYGSYKYRLKQVDFNGSYEYSDVVEITVEMPKEYSLSQNYPNPFNPTTTITYEIAEAGPVSLKVFDILGSEIAVLVNEVKLPGRYTVKFNTTGMPGGVYVYKFNADSYSAAKKMIVLK